MIALDTNVLIYACDRPDRGQHAQVLASPTLFHAGRIAVAAGTFMMRRGL